MARSNTILSYFFDQFRDSWPVDSEGWHGIGPGLGQDGTRPGGNEPWLALDSLREGTGRDLTGGT